MKRRLLEVLTVVAIAAGAAAACDRPTSPITSTGGSSPRLAVTSGGYTFGGYTLLTSSGSASQSRSAVVDQYGGKINFGADALQVPAGAVAGPTRFTFTLQTQPYVSAKLTAVAVTPIGNNRYVDGATVTVFAKPLTLTLSYAGAKQQLPDPSKLMVLWIENGNLMGVLKPDQVDLKGKKLISSLTHFTDYSPGVPGPQSCDPGSLMGCDPGL